MTPERLAEIYAASMTGDLTDLEYELLAEVDRLRAQVEALTSALERTEKNFISAVRGLPVRDMTENLAENAEALTDRG